MQGDTETALKMVNKNMKIQVAALNFLPILVFIWAQEADGNAHFVDYVENAEHIQQSVGWNVTLLCGVTGVISESETAEIKYFWYFKQCGENSGSSINCHDSSNDDEWTQLPCEDNFCRRELQLRNVTEKYSGLYKCEAVPTSASSLYKRLGKTFQLDVKNTSRKMPEFSDALTLNQSVHLGSKAVFQCCVISDEYVTIKWFRRLPVDSFRDHENLNSIVYYGGRMYELLTTPRKKSLGRDEYLSKLILNEVQPQDEGFYACVAINVWGHRMREVYLKVYVNEVLSSEYWLDYSEETDDLLQSDPKKFCLLFLMPLGLALLPLSVWLCYVSHKRCRRLDDQERLTNI